LPRKLERYTTTTGKIDRTLTIIKEARDEGITFSNLLKEAGIYRYILKEIVITLTNRGDIVIYKIGDEIKIFHEKYESNAIAVGGNKIPAKIFENLV
jgi:hypothetical protein